MEGVYGQICSEHSQEQCDAKPRHTACNFRMRTAQRPPAKHSLLVLLEQPNIVNRQQRLYDV